MSMNHQNPNRNGSNPPPAEGYSIPPPGAMPNGLPPPPRRKKRAGITFILFALAIILLMIGGVIMVVAIAMGGGGGSPGQIPVQETVVKKGTSGNKVVIIPVAGVIHGGEGGLADAGAKSIIKQLHKAEDDQDVVAIILEMDTPGGEVIATDEIYNEILKLRDDITVITYMRSVAASGGYYLAAGTDYIVAHRMTITGSIGVMWPDLNVHGLMQKVGVKSDSYHRGELKDIGNPMADPTPSDEEAITRKQKEDEIFQGLVDEVYEDFVQIVAKGRKLPVETVKAAPIGDSRILSGTQARKLKLVDELGFLEDAIKYARKTGDHKVVRYEKMPSFLDLLTMKATKTPPGMLQQMLPAEQRMLRPGRLYFLSPHVF